MPVLQIAHMNCRQREDVLNLDVWPFALYAVYILTFSLNPYRRNRYPLLLNLEQDANVDKHILRTPGAFLVGLEML